jgi:hypothetical protein
MDVTGNSDSDDMFEGDESSVFKQTALTQPHVEEPFGFEPKDKQVKAIRHLLNGGKSDPFTLPNRL